MPRVTKVKVDGLDIPNIFSPGYSLDSSGLVIASSTPGPQGPQGVPGPQGDKGDTGDQGPPGVNALWNYTGEYNNGAEYAVGDIATYAGSLWYRSDSNGGNVGDVPGLGSSFWDLLSSKGDQGLQGEQGIQGLQGPQGEPTDITDLEQNRLYSQVIYVNNSVEDIQPAIDQVTSQNILVWTSPGSYGGSTLTLNDKILLKLKAEGSSTGGFGIAELPERALTITGSASTRNLIEGFQIEGLATINGTQGRHAFINCQLLGGLTINNACSNFITIRDCEIVGPVSIAASVTAVIYFINCNFLGVTFSNSATPTQVIIANCNGFPSASALSVTLVGQNGFSDLSIRGFFSALTLPNALAFTGNTNQLTNGAGFITSSQAPVQSVNSATGAVTISGQNTNTNHTPINYTTSGNTLTQHLAGIDSKLNFLQLTYERKTTSFNASTSYHYSVDTSAGDVIATLPLSSSAGRVIGFKRRAGNHVLTVTPSGSNTIDSNGAYSLTHQEYIRLLDSGLGDWEIIK